MKTIVKAAMLFASALVVFSSCLKEQTGLSIEDIPGKAKIMGRLSINEGQTYEGGKFVDLKKPAANVEVIVKVSNSSLSPTSADGYTDYKTTTNEDGSFEVVIPAVDGGVSYEVVAPAIVGTMKTLSSAVIKDGEFLFEDQEGVYEFSKKGNGVMPGSVEVVNGTYTFEAFDKDVALSEYVDLRVAVGLGIPSKTRQGTDELQYGYEYNGEIEEADGVDVVVSVTYKHDDDGDYKNQTVSYGGTTGDDGHVLISLPCTSAAAMKSAEISIEAREFLGKDNFTYYSLSMNEENSSDKREKSATIEAEKYTFAAAPVKMSSPNFDFFLPTEKIVMTVNKIKEGADKGIVTRFDSDSNNDNSLEQESIKYYEDLKENYARFWVESNFYEIQDEE